MQPSDILSRAADRLERPKLTEQRLVNAAGNHTGSIFGWNGIALACINELAANECYCAWVSDSEHEYRESLDNARAWLIERLTAAGFDVVESEGM